MIDKIREFIREANKVNSVDRWRKNRGFTDNVAWWNTQIKK